MNRQNYLAIQVAKFVSEINCIKQTTNPRPILQLHCAFYSTCTANPTMHLPLNGFPYFPIHMVYYYYGSSYKIRSFN